MWPIALTLCFCLAFILHWIAISGAMRHEREIRQSSNEYATELFRANFFYSFLAGGSVCATTLLFVPPPEGLKEMMRPIRKMEAISMFFLALSVILYFATPG
jgi:hypothetical protein